MSITIRVNTCEHCLKVFTAYRFKRLCNVSCSPLRAPVSSPEPLQSVTLGNLPKTPCVSLQEATTTLSESALQNFRKVRPVPL